MGKLDIIPVERENTTIENEKDQRMTDCPFFTIGVYRLKGQTKYRL